MRIPTLPLPTAVFLALLACFILWWIGSTTPQPPKKYRDQISLTFSVEELQAAAVYGPYLPELRRIRLVVRQGDRKVPEAIQAFRQIRQLDILGNGEYCSLQALAPLSNLQVLCIDNIIGKRNSNYWGRLHQLRELHVINCQLENLPTDFNRWTNLEVLDLSNNQFTLNYYIEELMRLPRLQALRMDRNPIQRLPLRLFQHTTLQYLSLQYCKIKDTTGISRQNNTLQELYLNNNALTEFPINIFDLSKLKQLDLSNNSLDTLPEVDVLAMRLNRANFSNNQLKTIHPSWLYYPWMSHLNLELNQLETLPDIEGNASFIRYFNLRNNIFQTMPPVIMRMKELQHLQFQNNLFSTIVWGKHPSLSKIRKAAGGLLGFSADFRAGEQEWRLLRSYSEWENSPMYQPIKVN